MRGISIAQNLLLSLIRRESVLGPGDATLLCSTETRVAFLELAASHGLLGLALSCAERDENMARLPESVRAEVLASLPLLRRQATVRQLERDRVLKRLVDEGLPAMPLKGAVLMSTVYGSPVERPTGDLDVLVRPEQLDAAIECLAGLGYVMPYSERVMDGFRRHHFHVRVQHPSGFIAEIHWDLLPRSSVFRIEPGPFMSRGQLVDLGGLSAVCPAPDDMVIHLSTQNLDDGFSSLRRLVDIDRVVRACRDLDWDRMVVNARTGGTENLVALTLQLAVQLLGTPVPAGTVDRLCVRRWARLHLAIMRPPTTVMARTSATRSAVGALFVLHAASGWRGRWLVVRDLLRQRDAALRWLFERNPTPRPIPGAGVLRVLKLILFQLSLYGRAIASAVVPGQPGNAFWTNVPGRAGIRGA